MTALRAGIAPSGVLVIAEVGSVHDGSLGNAKRLIHAVADTGADVVKFQTHIAEAETLREAPPPPFFHGEPRFEYFQRTGFTEAQWAELRNTADEAHIEFSSSPFSEEAVDLLERVGVARYKIPSGEVTNTPLIEAVAQTKKPILLSSGMSNWRELDVAVDTVLKSHSELTVLQCTSEYPCEYANVGLNLLAEMRERYDLPVGLSDHTLTPFAAYAAVALGASVIEKHFTFSRLMYGSDAAHSMEPHEFRVMVEGTRAIEEMLNSPRSKDDLDAVAGLKPVFEKSVTTGVPIPAGTVISREMVRLRKPQTGIPAASLEEVIGRKTARDLDTDKVIRWDDLI